MSGGEKGPLAYQADMLKQGRFVIQRDLETGAFVYPPRSQAPGRGAALEWVEASGKGTVYAVTIVGRKPERGGNYNIAIVELEEGPRLMTRVERVAPEEVHIGMAVRARVAVPDFGSLKGTDQPAVLFAPANTAE